MVVLKQLTQDLVSHLAQPTILEVKIEVVHLITGIRLHLPKQIFLDAVRRTNGVSNLVVEEQWYKHEPASTQFLDIALEMSLKIGSADEPDAVTQRSRQVIIEALIIGCREDVDFIGGLCFNDW